MLEKIKIVYPDNNIIVAIEKGKITLDDIKTIVGSNDFIMPYSAAHIYEADTMTAYDSYTKEYLLEKRFTILDELSGGKYMFTRADKKILLIDKKAQDAYNGIKDFPDKTMISNGFQENMCNDNRKLYRKVMGLEHNVINSLSIESIIPHLNKQLKSVDTSSFTELVEKGMVAMSGLGTISTYDKIAIHFGLLDIMGFYRDAETDKSDFARMWDSFHASYAAETQLFLSNDKRARKKTELVYHLLNINVPVAGI